MHEQDYFPTGLANEVYMRTEPGDALRKLIVAFHVWIGMSPGSMSSKTLSMDIAH